MKRILIDVNVILDLMLEREPHFKASAAVCTILETGPLEGFVAAHGITTIHYLIRRARGPVMAARALGTILRVFSVAAVDMGVIQQALANASPDFEDAVTAAAAHAAGCDLIVTRDPKGFRGSAVRAVTPELAMPILEP